MKKSIGQGLILLLIFLAVWVGLSSIDWMGVFAINQRINDFSNRLTPLYIDFLKGENSERSESEIGQPIDSLLNAVCKSNHLSRSDFHVLVLDNSEVNAFALPGGYIVVNTGLLNALENPEELTAVLCHEMAHIRHKHVLKKMVREVGLATILASATGNNSNLLLEAARKLTSTAYDRSFESDADLTAADYLRQTRIDPQSLADALRSIQESTTRTGMLPEWLSTHPATDTRIVAIRSLYPGVQFARGIVLREATWKKLQKSVREGD